MIRRLANRLSKTREVLLRALRRSRGEAASGGLDPQTLEELEAVLITADLGPRLASELARLAGGGEPLPALRRGLLAELLSADRALAESGEPPTVYLFVGANGVGKTTVIAKVANMLSAAGKRVIVAAADTFRAAAVEQLAVLSRTAGFRVVSKGYNVDPASVAHEAVETARREGADYVLIDTAGRLHTKTDLMAQLAKIRRVLARMGAGPHETLLVLDAGVGQNGLVQAREFNEAAPLSGVIIAKLDGTAKGGIVFAVERELKIPVKLIGLGESMDDLAAFDPLGFVEAILPEGAGGGDEAR